MASKGATKSPAKQRGGKGNIEFFLFIFYCVKYKYFEKKRNIYHIIAIERPGLSEEEIEEIREAFNLFDADGSGKHTHIYKPKKILTELIYLFIGKEQLTQRN